MYKFVFGLLILMCSCTQDTNVDSSIDLLALINRYEGLQDDDDEVLWPSFDEKQLKNNFESYQEILSSLSDLDRDQFSTDDRINQDMLSLVLEDKIAQYNFKSHLMPLNAEGGFLAGILYSIRDAKTTTSEDYQKYLDKLNALPDYLTSRKAHLISGLNQGKVSPRLIVNNCISIIRNLLDTPPEESIFTGSVIDHDLRKKEVTSLVEKKIFPVYQDLLNLLETDYLDNAPEKIGMTEVKGGVEYYAHRTRYFTTFNISPEEVFEIGHQEVARIRSEMEDIIEQLDFKGTFDEFIDFLRTDPQFYPESGEQLLKEAAWITSKIKGELPKYFTHLPRMPLTVKPVPDALAPNYTGGRYSGGSFENHKSGQYWVNTYNLQSRPLYVLPSLSLHEGVPGHHTQIMLAGELEGVPDFRSNTYLSAFGEGWALYTEYLGKEMGIYTTPYEDFGRLVYEMWRACRLVVDPGMHVMGWTRDEAVKFLAENTALSMHEINTEVNRYIGWPAQAVSYKMGELKIRSLRKKAESALGDQFDIRIFHDQVLENGFIPLNTLERIIDQYIDEVMKAPLAD